MRILVMFIVAIFMASGSAAANDVPDGVVTPAQAKAAQEKRKKERFQRVRNGAAAQASKSGMKAKALQLRKSPPSPAPSLKRPVRKNSSQLNTASGSQNPRVPKMTPPSRNSLMNPAAKPRPIK